MAQKHLEPRRFVPWIAMLLVLLATSACSGELALDGGLSIRDDYTLSSDEYADSDQVVIANSVDLQPGSQVSGVVTYIGGTVDIAGEIDGDVTVVAEEFRLLEGARINGDLTFCAGAFQRDSSALVSGEVREQCAQNDTTVESVIEAGVDGWRSSPFVRGATTIGSALLFGALAALATLIMPAPLTRISRSMQRAPLAAGAVGFLAILASIGLTLIYVLSLVLILPLAMLPVVLIGWGVLVLLSVLGWIGLAEPFGRFVLARLGVGEFPRMVEAALGGMALTLFIRLWSVFWFTSWVGWVLSVILGSLALGAVLLTRIGRFMYPVPGSTSRAG